MGDHRGSLIRDLKEHADVVELRLINKAQFAVKGFVSDEYFYALAKPLDYVAVREVCGDVIGHFECYNDDSELMCNHCDIQRLLGKDEKCLPHKCMELLAKLNTLENERGNHER